MSWNYRVLAWQQEDNPYLQIHSVYYDKHGNTKAYTHTGEWAGGDTLKEIEQDLDNMKLALKKPILLGGDKFPGEYKPK